MPDDGTYGVRNLKIGEDRRYGQGAVCEVAALHPQQSAMAATRDSLDERRIAQLSDIALHQSRPRVLISLRKG